MENWNEKQNMETDKADHSCGCSGRNCAVWKCSTGNGCGFWTSVGTGIVRWPGKGGWIWAHGGAGIRGNSMQREWSAGGREWEHTGENGDRRRKCRKCCTAFGRCWRGRYGYGGRYVRRYGRRGRTWGNAGRRTGGNFAFCGCRHRKSRYDTFSDFRDGRNESREDHPLPCGPC